MDVGGHSGIAAEPHISACILNHNYAHYLREAIESCLGQQPGPYRLEEIVVLDDGSTDRTLQLCAEFGDQLRMVARPHRGFAATLSESIEHCRGDWVALLDADDWFAPEKLRTISPYLRTGTLMVQHWEYVVDGNGYPLQTQPHPGGNTSTLVANRRAALDLLPVANELFFHVLDDLGHGIRLTAPLTYYRVHGANMTNRSWPGVHQEYMADVCQGLAARLARLRTCPPSWASRRSLRRLSWHYRAEAAAHRVEAVLQRGRRRVAWRPLIAEITLTTLARRSWQRRLSSIRSVLVGQPLVRLARSREGEV